MDENGYKPFEILKKSGLKPRENKRLKPGPAKASSPKSETGTALNAAPNTVPDAPPDEAEMFQQAMHGVVPFDRVKGRAVHLEPDAPAQAPSGPSPEASAREHLKDIVQGKIEFELDLTGEYSQGRVLGLDQKILHRLKQGRFSVEAHLDLHGLNSEQAYYEVLSFIREQYHKGGRCVLLVTGRGKNSPEGFGVLRERIQEWLTREPLRRVVLAFATAKPKHGGAGALYVLLRKFKKSRGKVRWDRTPSDWEY
ncbi:MAG: Smr/MutS family protein [Thermodesulfobacteriota bacterium]|nr:Smr/MutS family protein [Thermodesulfobacteriota bacterium]